jgi:hypothetical protein
MEAIWVLPAIAGSIATAFVAKWLFQSPVGEAWAERIRANARRRRHWKGFGGEWTDVPGDGAGADDKRVAELESRLAALDGQLAELAERLDFAERLLADRRREQLGAR